MAVAKQVNFALGTVVEPDYLDVTQEINAGLAWGFALSIVGATITATVPVEVGSMAIQIQGKMRYIESTISVSFGGGDASGSYGIWTTTTATDVPNPGFALAKVLGGGNPAAVFFRKVATVEWDQAALKLTNLQQLVLRLPQGTVGEASLTDDAKKEIVFLSQVFS